MADSLRLLRFGSQKVVGCRQYRFPSTWERPSLLPAAPQSHRQTRINNIRLYAAGKFPSRRPTQAQRSQIILEQEQRAKGGVLPDDVGLMPSTFIAPLKSQLPSWTSEPGRRWRWEKARLKVKLVDILGYAAFKMYVVPLRDPARPRYVKIYDYFFNRYNLETSTLAGRARDMYEAMNTALGKGDLDPVSASLCASLRLNLQSRIRTRAPKEMRWTLHRHLARPKLVSYRCGMFDGKQQNHRRDAIQQAVVRLRSLQNLESLHKPGGPRGAEVVKPEPREVTEYVVIQKLMSQGVEGPWKIWGTTTPSPIDLDAPSVPEKSA